MKKKKKKKKAIMTRTKKMKKKMGGVTITKSKNLSVQIMTTQASRSNIANTTLAEALCISPIVEVF